MTATDKLAKRIVRTPGVCGGHPRIEGHRIRVRDIVMWFEALRMSADEIANEYDLSLSDIYLALAYYHANQQELQQEWDADDTYVEQLMEKYPSRLKAYLKGGKAYGIIPPPLLSLNKSKRLMNIQATKLELIRMITDIQSEQLLESLKQFLKEAEIEGKKGERAHALSREETELLSAINEGLPDKVHFRFMELQAKQKEGGLSEKEHQELMGLVDQVEASEGKWLERMIALAQLWNISLEELRERLGIKAPEPHVW